MLILTIRSDKPEAELGLYTNDQQLTYTSWQAHRELAESIHIKIEELLKSQGKALNEINAVLVFKGPGSFTGLRIGLTVGNALAESLRIPIVAEKTNAWISRGITRLRQGENEQVVTPAYGSPPHITLPRH